MESRKVPALKPPVIGFPSQLCSGVVRVESGAGRLAHAKPRNHCSKNIIDHLSEAKSRIRARHSSLAKFAGREGGEGAVVVVVSAREDRCRWRRRDLSWPPVPSRAFCNVTQYCVQTGN